MGYAAYPKMQKTHGFEIPEKWDIRRLKFCATCNDATHPEGLDPDTEIFYVDISSVNLSEGITQIEAMPFEKAPSRARRKTQAGDTLVSTVRTYLKAIAYIDDRDDLTASTGFAVLRPNDFLDSKYLSYYARSELFVGEVTSLSNGVSYPAINPTTLVCIPFIFPSKKHEQTQIARFLDHKTAQLDQLIAKKQALIERLNEQRIALITQAVTRGLNPDAALKDSGVEWLGQVPEGWEVLRFKDRCSIVGGQVDPTSGEYQDMTLIAPDHIEKDSGKIIKFESAKEQGAISGKYYYEAGCVLYSKIRPELNKVCIAETSGLCSADMYAITTDEHMDYRFLYYVMLSKYFYQFAVLESMRVAMPKVNRESLSVLPMVVPPLTEQLEIIDYLTQTTLKIDCLKQVTADTITRLEEYRTALITAAVTGKIDVREFEVPEGES
jgi:type I restriction enzyme, S subunit